jgi:hypothetical protein
MTTDGVGRANIIYLDPTRVVIVVVVVNVFESA